MPATTFHAVLFDLDGTLLDTAPDLAYALNVLLQEQDREPLSFETIRPHVSHGATALVKLGFALDPTDPHFEPLRQRFLALYKGNLARETCLFEGMAAVLEDLESRGIAWGVVTNKPAWLTEPLLDALELRRRAACVISGDTLAVKKPHPEPLLVACKQIGADPVRSVYVGDAERDVAAARAAGMRALVAHFGYLGAEDRPHEWGAHGHITRPDELLTWMNLEGRDAS